MSKLLSLIILSAVLFLPAPALAEDLRLPYPDFKAGFPAYADSMDANFEALRTGINVNAGRITANGEDIAVNAGGLGSIAGSLEKVREDLAAHGHGAGDINPAGSGSGLDADLLDGLDGTAFAESIHAHRPDDIVPQGKGSGLDADLLDGMDSSGFSYTGHGHDGTYAFLAHGHDASDITGPVDARTLGGLAPSSFSPLDHAHQEYAASFHDHDAQYAAGGHTHEDLADGLREQGERIAGLEAYGDLSGVLEEVAALKRMVAGLRARIEELEAGAGDVPGK